MFHGIYTAIVTPFSKGRVDKKALREFVEWQIQEGVHGLVPCGTTGEGVTLSDDEWEEVIRTVIEQTSSRVPIIVGAGSNCTETAVKKTKRAQKLGVSAVLQVTPYYNKPTQEGLYQHFKAVAAAVPDLPVVLYNVPGRTAVNMLPETTARLAKIKNIVGIKEACGNLDQIKKLKSLVPSDFAILSGEDAQNLSIYELGGVGAISVASNIVPAKVVDVWNKFKDGDVGGAKIVQEGLNPLNKAIFIETNPIPVKTALSLMGKIKEEFRLPLTPMGNDNKKQFVEVLRGYRLI